MLGSTLFDPKEVEDFIENFLNYVKTDFSIDVDDGTFWNDVTKIESVLIKYFTTYRLKNNVLPKRNTLEGAKSHIKCGHKH